MQHDHTLNPVTALASFNPEDGCNYLVAAEGVYLKVFDLSLDSPRLIAKCRAFSSQTVHGIVILDVWNPSKGLQAVVWGGTSIVLLDVNIVRSIISGTIESFASKEQSALDWILDVALPSDPEVDSCVFITAHNETVRAKTQPGTPKLSYEKLNSPSRSILYSAHLTLDSPNCVTVAAGTVFGEIIVWQCYPGQDGSQVPSRVLHTFTGHEGSIFGVNISPIIVDSKGISARYLASCSDDRTIRVWDITSSLIGNADSKTAPCLALTARETGFGPNHERIDENDNRCVAVVMAHASRIWRVQFYLPSSTEVDRSEWINILSFGEDSDSQQWCLKKDSGSTGAATLEHVQTSAFHSGKHIWSATMGNHNNGGKYLATGGADGAIALSLLSLKQATSVTSSEEEISKSTVPTRTTNISELGPQYGFTSNDFEMSVQDILRELPGWKPEPIPEVKIATITQEPQETSTSDSKEVKPKKKKVKPVKIPMDAFNRYAFVSQKEFLVTSTFGKVLLATITIEGLSWEELPMPVGCEQDLRSYAIMVGSPEDGVAFLAGANGNLFMYSGGTITLAEKLTGKIASIFVAKTSRLHQMATFLGSLTAVLNNYEVTEGEESSKGKNYNTALVNSSVVQLSPGFVVTSMAATDTLLILGSRKGKIDIYSWKDLQKPLMISRETPYKSKDAITSIIELPKDSSLSPDTCNILLASRDGTYSIVSITAPLSSSNTTATLVLLHHASPPLGQIESAYFHQSSLFLYGFRSKRFIVWNETAQREVASIECGGAHRSYATSGFTGLDQGGKFVYTKASKMCLHNQLHDSHIVIQNGGHGREIKACAVSKDQRYFATGAEDTTIRIWQYSDSQSDTDSHSQKSFEALATVQKHAAGIQYLQWHGPNYLISSGGNEELFIWAVSSIPTFGVGVVCEASCPEQSAEKDLRIMALDISSLPNSSSNAAPTLLITFAFSDSTIRSYAYSKPTGFVRLAQAEYTSACLMQLKHVIAHDTVYILTAATDGYLAYWRLAPLSDLVAHTEPVDIQLLSRHRVHQSAVKCLDIATVGDGGGLVVATGGDDNGVAVTVYGSGDGNETGKPKTLLVGDAHAAAVTALSILPGESRLRLVSSSNDQRVLLWDVELDGDVRLSVASDVFTSIADVADMGVLGTKEGRTDVLVVGNGMDVWRV